MSLLGEVDLKITEFPGTLEFTVTREVGLIETVAIPAITIFVLMMFWFTGNLWIRFIACSATAFTAFAVFANWIQGNETKLRATSDGVTARGNLGQLFITSVAIARKDISTITFHDGGGDGGISGLYVRHRWRFRLVLPYISREQAQTIVDAINHKFPDIPTESALNSCSPSGGLISLGLSESEHVDKQP